MEIELRGINKHFGSVRANHNINLNIKPGQVLGLLGENGAGKSTLMNVLSGLYAPDAGQIIVDGTEVEFSGPGESIAKGIGMVHQHFMLVPVFSVAENVILGNETVGFGDYLNLNEARQKVKEISKAYGLHVPPDVLIEDLPVGLQQRVEILKVLFRSANVLILDEPTAVLTPQEVEAFFGIVRALRDAGKAIVFITHKLHEILEIADHVNVLRQGEVVGGGNPADFSEADLAELMVGRPVSFTVARTPAKTGHPILRAQDVSMHTDTNDICLEKINLQVAAGEVVGIAGVQGNGQTELIEAICGLAPIRSGTLTFEEQDISSLSVRQRHQLGIAHIPEDRQKSGMIGTFSVAENMVLNAYYESDYASGIEIDWQKAHEKAAASCVKYDVRTPSVFLPAGSLSGGNQQKMVVARELERSIKLVVAAQPTRGVDVGSIEYIHKQLIACRDAGNGVVVISSELDEIINLSDRIYVMFDGRISGEFDNTTGQADRQLIGLAMAGAGKDVAA